MKHNNWDTATVSRLMTYMQQTKAEDREHLTDEEFCLYSIGGLPDATTARIIAHLAACDLCAAEMHRIDEDAREWEAEGLRERILQSMAVSQTNDITESPITNPPGPMTMGYALRACPPDIDTEIELPLDSEAPGNPILVLTRRDGELKAHLKITGELDKDTLWKLDVRIEFPNGDTYYVGVCGSTLIGQRPNGEDLNAVKATLD